MIEVVCALLGGAVLWFAYQARIARHGVQTPTGFHFTDEPTGEGEGIHAVGGAADHFHADWNAR